jgi:hypothetical protein
VLDAPGSVVVVELESGVTVVVLVPVSTLPSPDGGGVVTCVVVVLVVGADFTFSITRVV